MQPPPNNLDEIYLAALALSGDRERAAFLDQACAGDPRQRERVERLLRAQPHVEHFLESVAAPFAPTISEPQIAEKPGTQIGPYKLLEQIGEGGFGIVFMAEQQQPVRRKVALKVLKPGMDSQQVIARFEAERQALALMDHPNIASVLDAGATESGRPYFVMELVKGVPITAYCDEHQLSPRERLELFVPVCQAVQHAHQKGIIHRDIKPSNVLVAQHDGRPVVKVIDFGVAKALGQQLTDKTVFTGLAQMIGTPLYMSPEQAEFSGLDVDTRTDIYSLGVLLYELLTGTTPFDKERLKSAAFDEIRRIIREDEPPKPSTRLSELSRVGSAHQSPGSTHSGKAAGGHSPPYGSSLASIAALRKMEPRKLSQLVRGDLDWIVMKALEKDRNRRYETANGFAMDVQRYLVDEPVLACPPSAWYRFRKLARKYRKALVTAAAFAALLVTGTVVATWEAVQATLAQKDANDQRDAATIARDDATQAKNRAEASARETRRQLGRVNVAYGMRIRDEGDLFGSLPWFAHALSLDQGDLAREQVHRFRVAAVLEASPRPVHIWFHEAEPNHTEFSSDGSRVLVVADSRTFVWDVLTGQLLTSLEGSGNVRYASFSPDGVRVVTASEKMSRVWDVATGGAITPPLEHELPVWQAFFSPDGRRLVTVSCPFPPPGTRPLWNDGQARVWDALSGAPIGPPRPIGFVKRPEDLSVPKVWFSPDSRRVVTGNQDGTAAIWDADTGEPITTLKLSQGIWRVFSFSSDSQRVVTTSGDWTARVWNAATGALIATLRHNGEVMTASFSPDGLTAVTASLDGTARVWNAATGEPVTAPLRHQNEVNEAWFSPDGRCVATGSWDFTARIWDAATGAPLTPPLKHGAKVSQVAFSPEGRWLLTTGFDRTVRMWDTAPAEPVVGPFKHRSRLSRASFSLDGRHVVTASDDSTARVWDAITGQPVSPALAHGGAVHFAGFSRDGRLVVTTSADQTARIWDALSGAPVSPPLKHKGPVRHASLRSDGRKVVTASEDGTAQLWDVATGEKLKAPLKHDAPSAMNQATFSPDDHLVVTAGWDGAARVWDAETGEPVTPLLRHPHGGLWGASFSPDGRLVLTWSENHTACLWNAATGELLASLNHGSNVSHAEFSQDGRSVLTASTDKTARIWSAATGLPIAPPLKHNEPISLALFSPNGRRILTRTCAGTAQIWETTTSEPISPPLKHWGPIEHAAFSPDGSTVVTAGRDGAARVWRLPSEERPIEDVMRLAQVLSSQQIQEGGEAIGFVPLETDQLKKDWELLRAKYPRDFAPAADAVLAWRQHQAEARAKAGQWTAAIFQFGQLIEAQPDQWRHFAARARAYGELQQWHKATTDYAKALDLGADNPAVREQAGVAQQRLGDLLLAEKQPEQASQAYGISIEIFQKLCADFPEVEAYWQQLGDRCLHLGQWDKAAGAYAKVIELKPGTWEGWYWRAQALAQLNQPEKAMADLRQAIALGFNNVEQLKNDPKLDPLRTRDDFGELLREVLRKEKSNVSQVLPQAPAARASQCDRLRSLGELFRRQQLDKEAEDAFQTALEISKKLVAEFPGNDAYRSQLGHTLWQLADLSVTAGRHDEAGKALRRALDVFEALAADFPGTPYYRLSQGYTDLKLGGLMQQLGRPKDAEEPLRRALAIHRQLAEEDPKTGEYHLRLGQSYTELLRVLWSDGRNDEAVRLAHDALDTLSTAVREHGDVPATRDSLGRFHHNLANLQRERAQNEDALKNYTQAAAIWGKLADDVPAEPAYRGHQAYVLTYDLPPLLAAAGPVAELEAVYRQAIAAWEKLASVDPRRTDVWIAVGGLSNLLVNAGRFQDAEQVWTNAVEKWPARAVAFRNRAEYFLRFGLLKEAAADLARAYDLEQPGDSIQAFVHALLRVCVADGPGYRNACRRMLARFADSTNPDDWNHVAAALAISPEPGVEPLRAVALAERAVASNKLVWRMAYLGLAHYRAGQSERATAALEESLVVNANWNPPWVHSALAMAQYRLGKGEQAVTALDKARSAREERVEAMLAREVGYWPGPWWDVVYGELLYDEASALIRGSPPSEDPRLLILRGRALRAIGRADEARTVFDKAFDLKPGDLLIRVQALPQVNQNDAFARALTDLRAFLKEHPDQPEGSRLALARAHLQWGARQWIAGHRPEAETALDQATEVAPQSAQVLLERGNLWLIWNEAARAIDDYSRALECVQDAAPRGVVYQQRALAHSRLGRHAEARDDWQQALDLAPANALVHNNLAWLLATCADTTLRDPPRAVALAAKAVELEPTQGMYRNTLGAAQYRAGDWAAAIEALNKSMELRQGGDAFDWFFLAMAEWQLGNKDAGRGWYDKASQWINENQKALQGNRAHAEELQRFDAEARDVLGIKDN